MLAFINGFDDNMHSGVAFGTIGTITFSATARNGSAGMFYNNAAAIATNYLGVPIAGDATVIVGAALRYDTASAATCIAMFCSDNGSTCHVTVTLNPTTGVLAVWRGSDTGTLLGQVTLSGIPLLTGTWVFWEVKCVLSDTVGEVHVRWNGNAAIDLTGVDTKNAGTKTVIDTVAYPCAYKPGSSTLYIDDFYIVTGTGTPNDFLGDCKVVTLYPSGNGDFSQLVNDGGNSTNNYSRVNEAGAPVTTSYVESATPGQRDFYAMADLSGLAATATVLGVQVTAWANNADGGTGRNVKVGVRQGTSESLSAAQPLTAATFLAERGVFTTDPATGAAWSQAGVNSMQAGMEVA